mmetsp:Transcript_37099/g.97544  ORF Transcript_37099/g.97544 Transcript_37099/m.97544 type:complete len:213 (+) Transcript_37099:298-936(+)
MACLPRIDLGSLGRGEGRLRQRGAPRNTHGPSGGSRQMLPTIPHCLGGLNSSASPVLSHCVFHGSAHVKSPPSESIIIDTLNLVPAAALCRAPALPCSCLGAGTVGRTAVASGGSTSKRTVHSHAAAAPPRAEGGATGVSRSDRTKKWSTWHNKRRHGSRQRKTGGAVPRLWYASDRALARRRTAPAARRWAAGATNRPWSSRKSSRRRNSC